MQELRLDIATLRALIDAALERGVSGKDYLLQQCANLLYERRLRLEQLEQTASANEQGDSR